MFESKYALNIDGSDWSSSFPHVLYLWSRSFHLYHFFVESVFLKDLKPWVHFVPQYLNESNLLEKLECCRANENICKQTGEIGRQVMQRFMKRRALKRSLKSWVKVKQQAVTGLQKRFQYGRQNSLVLFPLKIVPSIYFDTKFCYLDEGTQSCKFNYNPTSLYIYSLDRW